MAVGKVRSDSNEENGGRSSVEVLPPEEMDQFVATCEEQWHVVPGDVRRVIKEFLENRVRVEMSGVSRQGVTAVVLSVKVSGRTYRSLGTSKWKPPDVFDPGVGFNKAYNAAMIELVDLVIEPYRRMPSVCVI